MSEHVSKQRIQQLFGALPNDVDGEASTGEKLLLHTRVKETDKPDQESRKKPEDEEEGGRSKAKFRYLCITSEAPRIVTVTQLTLPAVKKSGKAVKIRIHKIKTERNGETLSIVKTWNLDDVKSLESGKDTAVLANLGKQYLWEMDSGARKIEFLYTIVELSNKYLKRAPKLVNLDEELLRDQMQLAVATLKEADAEASLKDTLEVVEDEKNIPVPREEDKSVPSNLDSIDLDEVLSDFSWRVSGDATDLELRLITELQALEAANVYAIIESEDQANAVVEQIDNALSQLNYIDEWLAYYTDLLDRMGQDVHQVEVRNKAMQTASVNQKNLLSELEKILPSFVQAALKLPGYVAESLRNEPLDDPDGILHCERASTELIRVMGIKIDPVYTEMTVVSERMQLFNGYARQFCTRLCDHLVGVIGSQAECYLTDKSRLGKRGTPRVGNHDQLELKLFNYRKLIKWMKEVDTRKHYELEMHYIQEFGRVYRKEMHDFLEFVRHNNMQRKVNAEEQELYIFVQQQVSVSSAATNALTAIGSKAIGNIMSIEKGGKLEVPTEKKKSKLDNFKGLYRRKSTKDSQSHSSGSRGEEDDDAVSTLSKYMAHSRKGSDSEAMKKVTASINSLEISSEDKMMPDETINYIFAVFCGQMQREQNFIMDLFTFKTRSEDENVSLSRSAELWQDDLTRSREKLKDVRVNNRIQEICEGLFDDIREDIITVVEAGLKYDQTFVVGMMSRVEECKREFETTAYFYVHSYLEAILMRLAHLLDKFIDEQIKAIEETKVTLKKRSGILPFIRTFPRFVDRLESFIAESEGFCRSTVSKAYERLVKVIFDTVDVVARDVFSDQKDAKGALDDKEQLNIHILTVENMHHFYSEMRARKVPGLEPFVKAAKSLYDVSLNSYVKVVIRKPLGKLLEFFEGVDDLLNTLAPEEVSFHLQYSKAALKEIIKRYPGKEIKKGLEQLYKRVDKHFTDEEGLLQVVWRGIQQEFTRQVKRYEEIISLCYADSGIRIDFSVDDLLGYFSDMAKMH
ncbi:Exocyst complex component 1 [Dinochytrium kinnereticum]|nr:Exocyst complex component 1 [Dinochytrium kinnereticum]